MLEARSAASATARRADGRERRQTAISARAARHAWRRTLHARNACATRQCAARKRRSRHRRQRRRANSRSARQSAHRRSTCHARYTQRARDRTRAHRTRETRLRRHRKRVLARGNVAQIAIRRTLLDHRHIRIARMMRASLGALRGGLQARLRERRSKGIADHLRMRARCTGQRDRSRHRDRRRKKEATAGINGSHVVPEKSGCPRSDASAGR